MKKHINYNKLLSDLDYIMCDLKDLVNNGATLSCEDVRNCLAPLIPGDNVASITGDYETGFTINVNNTDTQLTCEEVASCFGGLDSDEINVTGNFLDGFQLEFIQGLSITTNGNSNGISQNPTDSHDIDITILSNDTDQILQEGLDGGVYLNCEKVKECVCPTGATFNIELTENPFSQTVAYWVPEDATANFEWGTSATGNTQVVNLTAGLGGFTSSATDYVGNAGVPFVVVDYGNGCVETVMLPQVTPTIESCPTGGQAIWYSNPLTYPDVEPLLLVVNTSDVSADVTVDLTNVGGINTTLPVFTLAAGGSNNITPSDTSWAFFPATATFDYGNGCTETILVTPIADTRVNVDSDSMSTNNPMVKVKSLNFAGENDNRTTTDVNTETDSIAQKVYTELVPITTDSLLVDILVENYSTHTRASEKFGDDSTGLVNRTDKPFKTIRAARNAMLSSGIITTEYALTVDAGYYEEQTISIPTNQTLNLIVDSGATIDTSFFVGVGATLNIEGNGKFIHTGAGGSGGTNLITVFNTGNLNIQADSAITNLGYTISVLNSSKAFIDIDYIEGGVSSQDSETYVYFKEAVAAMPNTVGYNALFKSAVLNNTDSFLYLNGQKATSNLPLIPGAGNSFGASVYSSAQGGTIWVSVDESYSENGSVASATTNNSNISTVHLLKGRYVNNSTIPTITTDISTVGQVSRINISSGCVLIANTATFTVGATAIDSEVRFYEEVSANKGADPMTIIPYGTINSSINVI